jgi:hypothetical protein
VELKSKPNLIKATSGPTYTPYGSKKFHNDADTRTIPAHITPPASRADVAHLSCAFKALSTILPPLDNPPRQGTGALFNFSAGKEATATVQLPRERVPPRPL